MILLKRALQALDLWPRPGQVAPPCGYTPDQMRREIRSVINRTDGELLLTMFRVVLVLRTMRDEFAPSPPAKIRRNGLEFDSQADWNGHRAMVKQALANVEQILREGGRL